MQSTGRCDQSDKSLQTKLCFGVIDGRDVGVDKIHMHQALH